MTTPTYPMHCHDNDHVLQSIADNARAILMDNCSSTASVIASGERQSIQNQEAINRNGLLNLQSTERNGGDTRVAGERSHAETRGLIAENGAANQLATVTAETATQVAFKESIIEMLKGDCAIENKILKGFGSIERQACEYNGSVKLDVCNAVNVLSKQASDGFSATLLEMCKNTSAIQMEAFKNKSELAAQLAECCCEMKTKLVETTASTQDLIRSNEQNRLRDALAASTQENLILRLKTALPTIPT